MELRPGHRLDRYELVAPIARGGMGAVWLARVRRVPGFEKFFAIKTVLPELATDEGFRQMFLDEARIACAINHSNVASILDVGEEAGTLFTVMEWVEGDSLQTLHRTLESEGGHIPHGVALRIVTDACEGLHAVHEARDRGGKPLDIVHRDISPHNILIDPQGQAKLIDFGIARARDRLAETTTSGGLKGKVRYMSPEQAAGEPLDRRADIWAAGAVLYRIIEGRAPLEGDNDLSVLKLLLSGKAESEPMRSDLPAPLAAVIMKCLRLDRNERYATADELRRALEFAMRDAHMITTASDVAAFVGSRLQERALARRAKIESTLRELDSATPLPETPAPLGGPGDSSHPGRGRLAGTRYHPVRTELGLGRSDGGQATGEPVEGTLAGGSSTHDVPGRSPRARRLALLGIPAIALLGVGVLAGRLPSRGAERSSTAGSSTAEDSTARAARTAPPPPAPPPAAEVTADVPPAPEASSRVPPKPEPRRGAGASPPRARAPSGTPSPPASAKPGAPSDVFDSRE